MVDFRFLLWAKRNGFDLTHHTDCIDNVLGKCAPCGLRCDDKKDCPVKKQRREVAHAKYLEELKQEEDGIR